VLALLCPALVRAAEDEEPTPPHEVYLARFDIQPTSEGLRQYLLALHPGPEIRRQTARLIRRLGDESFAERQQAMKQLLRMPMPDTRQLQAAAAEGDPEVRWRAATVAADVDNRRDEVLLAAYKTIAQRELSGLAEPVLGSLPLVSKPYLRRQAQAALAATCAESDVPLLAQRLDDDSPHVRIAALATLAAVKGRAPGDVAAEARRMLSDEDDQVRLTAAVALARLGRRESLAQLEKLLGSGRLQVRLEAARTLRSLTGQMIAFTAYESPDVRDKQRAAWRRWIEADGATAELQLPLRRVAYELGRTLVCNYTESKLYEYDARHKLIWEKSVGPQPWCCQGLPDGHRLVASYNNKDVVEYDETGKEVWSAKDLPGGPTGVQRLENGNTLIACTDSGQVVEVDPHGKVVWDIHLEGRPVEAQRLDSGRTLVVLQNAGRVVEVDRKGKVLWDLSDAASTFSAQRLDSGNTLVCVMGVGEVVEYDREKKKVWSHGGLSNPYDVQRTAAGTTMIVDATGVTEVDRNNKVVWHLPMSGVSRAYRY
jgi:HEAT repeat protein